MESYILQVICFQAIFFGIYYTLLRKETFFNYNRAYILGTVLSSFIIPLIKVSLLQTAVHPEVLQMLLPEVILGRADDIKSATLTGSSIGSINPWLIIYMLGIVVSTALLAIKISKLIPYFLWRKKGKCLIEIPKSKEAFTLFNYIFIGEAIDPLSRKQILTHERVHVKQKHTWDLALFELLRIVMWFNPLVYLFQNQITILHEYLADQKAVTTQSKTAYYQEILNIAFDTHQVSFTNTFFNQSLIKKRISMLQKSKSKKIALVKYTLIVPLLLSMLVYVSCSEENELETEQSLEQQIASLQLAIEEKGEISENETLLLNELNKTLIGKSNINPVFTLRSASNAEEIREVVEQEMLNDHENEAIPFAVIDEVPIFPGCEGLSTNKERKACMSRKITEIIGGNFNTSIGKNEGISGVNRIYASFKIDKSGAITNLKTRAPHPSLDLEAQRVISLLPKMTPGKQNGKPVNVMYSLPITFAIEE